MTSYDDYQDINNLARTGLQADQEQPKKKKNAKRLKKNQIGNEAFEAPQEMTYNIVGNNVESIDHAQRKKTLKKDDTLNEMRSTNRDSLVDNPRKSLGGEEA